MADINDFNYVYVLDCSDCTICEIVLTDDDKHKEFEDIIEEYGCNTNTCSWMTSKNRIYGITTLNNDKITSNNEDW